MLSLDSQVVLLLCSHLGLAKVSDLAPLTLREWNPLARKIQVSKFIRPEGLLGQTADEIKEQLDLSETEAGRLVGLLERNDVLVSELARLASQGIRVMTRADSDYPQRYRQHLNESAPAVLFYAGEPALLGQPGIAVVGSRHLDQAGQECATFIGNTCGLSGLVLYSGGAKGVDTLSMKAALEARGSAIGILADGLERSIRDSENRSAISRGDLCLATPYSPNAGFSAGAAMGRNRLIYCLADYAIVVASDAGKGGTWGGATEALKAGWIPVFVLAHPAMPEGNRLLMQKGGVGFPYPFPEHYSKLPGWLLENSAPPKPKATQPGLF
jgi:predicted Rossmann fold nucleotide-binding protein DprA/Smf involved in DNA uptake